MATTVEVSAIAALREFFGSRPVEHRALDVDGNPLSAIQDFGAEMKKLSAEEKQELGLLAAEALGKTLKRETEPK